MPITDEGLLTLASFVRGLAPGYPQYVTFSNEPYNFTGSEVIGSIQPEYVRKALTWGWNGRRPKFVAILATTDANGSYIQSTGLTDTASVTSGVLYSFDNSAIGSKSNVFDVQVTGEIDVKRPI